MSATEYLEMERQHPPRQIRIGDGVLVIDRPCTTCFGSGKFHHIFTDRPDFFADCPECDGHGRNLTDEGRVFIEAVRDWIGRPERPQYHSAPGNNSGGPNGTAGR